MGRLRQMTDIDSLMQFAKQRAQLGMTLFYNVSYQLKDGQTLLYPGYYYMPNFIVYFSPFIMKII